VAKLYCVLCEHLAPRPGVLSTEQPLTEASRDDISARWRRGERDLPDDAQRITIVNGLAVCPDHVYLAARPGFDLSTLLTEKSPR
jgi:hypothetical protein